ncbi:MAG: hypothetical protein JWN01_980 [Patescibacteria group bacterium]|nr:hypothetical protein [Patescibacteria group bacterium]
MAAQQPQPRPAAGRRPVAPVQRQPMARPAAAQQPAQSQPQASSRRGGGWRVVAQFVIGLLVIIGVAAAIVALYVRYYQ